MLKKLTDSFNLRTLAAVLIVISLSSCTTVVVNLVVDPTVENLQKQTDLNLVCEGAPAFLLIIDSLIVSSPDNTRMLLTGTQAYTAYVTALNECGSSPERIRELSAKAKKYGLALLAQFPQVRDSLHKSPAEFAASLTKMKKKDVPALFWGGYGWATYLQYQSGSPASMADLPKVEMIMAKVIELDDSYYQGAAHIFMGVYYGARPQMLGGKPEKSREHFERALAISDRCFLPVQVAYAETYAKMQFNRDLYVKLLQEALDFPLEKKESAYLSNLVAKRRAKKLLAEVDDIF